VNTGAAMWPDADSAYFAVRRMQTKLYRWATEDHGRRFGDLFNLVYDPAFLVHAWERVSTNKGASTAGIDRATVAQVEAGVGVEAFLGQIRDSLKSGEFFPVEVRQVARETGRNRHGRFPRSLLSVRRVRHPAVPLRHRHGYAVDNSPWPSGPDSTDPARSSHPK
jgi:hypothetical protein